MEIKVAIIQQKAGNVEHSIKTLQSSLALIDQAVREKPDLVVLPECIFPGYLLGMLNLKKLMANGWPELEMSLISFCSKARQHEIYLIVGAPEMTKEGIFNSAYLIDPAGKIVGTARKSCLWHFDSQWFSSGSDYPVFETTIGKIGMIVCADGRQPEISRILALKGAQLIVDVTNLVSAGATAAQLSNPQAEYILPCRAAENRVWYIVANKVGIEAESIVYCGKSCIISPDGEKLVTASSDQEEIIYGELAVSLSDNKQFAQDFNVERARNPHLYKIISSAETKGFPVLEVLSEKLTPNQLSFNVGVAQWRAEMSLAVFLVKLYQVVPIMSLQYSRMLVFPELACLYEDGAEERILPAAAELAREYGVALVLGTTRRKEAQKIKAGCLTLPSGEQYFSDKCHLTDWELRQGFSGGTSQPVFETPFGRVGIMMGYEGLVPEVARCLMLQGADLICWINNYTADYVRLFSRTRASENKVYLLVSNVWREKSEEINKEPKGDTLIVNPSGNILATALANTDQVISAQLELAQSRCKTIVTGTDVVQSRIPQAYSLLSTTLANQ